MKLKTLLWITLFYSVSLLAQDSMIVSFKLTPEIKAFLRAHEYDVTGVNLKTNEIEALLTQKQIIELKSLKAKFTFTFPQTLAAGPSQEYKNPQEIEDFIKEVHASYPDITEVKSIGKSWEGREIYAIKISDNAKSREKEPVIFFNGMHHAREVMTTEITTDLVDYLTKNYGVKSEVTKWVNDNEIWVIPMYNVDGNNKMWNEYAMWRKNTHAERGNGVDLNRNYPKDWNACQGSSVDPYSDVFRGFSPASEPETKAMMAFVESIKPVFSISYHSYSELVLYPYGCSYKKTPALEPVEMIGKEIAKILDYTPGTPWEILYNADGGDMDWMYAEQQVIPYVIEVNNTRAGFHPDYAKWRNQTVELNRKGWMHLLSRMEGPSIQGLTAEYSIIRIHQAGQAEAFQTYKVNPNGTFFVILKPGSYDFTFEGAGKIKKLTNLNIQKKEVILL